MYGRSAGVEEGRESWIEEGVKEKKVWYIW